MKLVIAAVLALALAACGTAEEEGMEDEGAMMEESGEMAADTGMMMADSAAMMDSTMMGDTGNMGGM